MTGTCDRIRELLSDLLDGNLTGEDRSVVDRHLAACDGCRETLETLTMIAASVPPLAELDPPEHLAHDLASSPCRRWLGLLFQAVDREIAEPNLERLLSHLESCESCTRAWNDLTLIHQVQEALEPPPGFVQRVLEARSRVFRRPILSRRAVTAAAYAMAVLVSLTIGNPVSIARSPVVQMVTTEVNEVAEQSRGELKVMMWRAWKWADQKIDAVRALVGGGGGNASSDDSQGEEQ
jgi:predicted anti-sigma-YlaC factor YlaD